MTFNLACRVARDAPSSVPDPCPSLRLRRHAARHIPPLVFAALAWLCGLSAYAQADAPQANAPETGTSQASAPDSDAAQEEGSAGAGSRFDRKALPEVLRNLERRGVDVVAELESPGGLQAYAAIAQQQPLALYLTPDQKHVIVGTMMDVEGLDVTQQALEDATLGPWTTQTWDALSRSAWVADGSSEATRIVYMFTDANCPFCHRFWQQARPWVDSGAVQIRHIPVAVLTETSEGKAAAILAADDPAKALHEHETAGPNAGIEPLKTIPPQAAAQLSQNNDLMKTLQIEGTPGIFYFDADDALQVQRGAPFDEHLEQILGPRP